MNLEEFTNLVCEKLSEDDTDVLSDGDYRMVWHQYGPEHDGIDWAVTELRHYADANREANKSE